jgi:hypothetical protein
MSVHEGGPGRIKAQISAKTRRTGRWTEGMQCMHICAPCSACALTRTPEQRSANNAHRTSHLHSSTPFLPSTHAATERLIAGSGRASEHSDYYGVGLGPTMLPEMQEVIILCVSLMVLPRAILFFVRQARRLPSLPPPVHHMFPWRTIS